MNQVLHILFDLHEPSAANCFLSQILPGYAVAGWNHHQINNQTKTKQNRRIATTCAILLTHTHFASGAQSFAPVLHLDTTFRAHQNGKPGRRFAQQQ
jgi:hypothetical protein